MNPVLSKLVLFVAGLLGTVLLVLLGLVVFSPTLREVREGPGGYSALLQLLRVNVWEGRVPDYTLPDPLAGLETADDWRRIRRREILDHFTDEVYGASPTTDVQTLGLPVVGPTESALGGRARRREVRIPLSSGPSPRTLDLLIHLPAEADSPAPVFLALNFRGNHTIHPDPGIRLSDRWVPAGPPSDAAVDHRPSEASRGARQRRWPIDRIVERGYGLATFYMGDLEPDHVLGHREGVRGILAEEAGLDPQTWGAIAAWSFGLRRALDHLETDPEIAGSRVAVVGHSRLGKAALWAGAQDERIAMVISNESGCLGAALSRRRFGETFSFITRAFPHWFRARFSAERPTEESLPFDQHMLLALIAPRPLYVASAAGDLWSDPRGEFLAVREASRVYHFLGVEGLAADEWPAVGESITSRVGYHLREGGHGVTSYDWERFLDFADRHL